MNDQCLTDRDGQRHGEWRVAKKIKPGQRGAIKLARRHGAELICVRYRESPDGLERLTTVELVVERCPIQKRRDPIVLFKLKRGERELYRRARALGAQQDPLTGMWKLARSKVLSLGLFRRIAVTQEELDREQLDR